MDESTDLIYKDEVYGIAGVAMEVSNTPGFCASSDEHHSKLKQV